MENTPVVDTIAEKVDTQPEKPKDSPAKDLREIQALLVNGTFPGNVAPQVVKAYHLLDQMCQQIEKEAK
jgi:hypothetical protein